MPIEIKELHIKIHVDEGAGNSTSSGNPQPENKGEIIAACVEEVMEVIRQQKER